MSSITVAGLRNKYKFPSSLHKHWHWWMVVRDLWKMVLPPFCTYCVGGALLTEMRRATSILRFYNPGFPPAHVLAYVLRLQNPRLPFLESQQFADSIIDKNDHRRFDEAWRVMEEAFSWEPQPEPVLTLSAQRFWEGLLSIK